MRITKDYSEIAEITGGEVLATPEYLQAQEVEDWGYIVHDSFVLLFTSKRNCFSGIYCLLWEIPELQRRTG